MKRINPFESLSTSTVTDNKIDTEPTVEVSNNSQKNNVKNNINSLFSKVQKDKKIIKTIYISENLSNKLNTLSKKHDISVNEVIATILEKTLE